MGSFWATQVAAVDDRLKACLIHGMCLEPGMNTIFNTASPTFKMRFMYMTGFEDEAEFDKFAQTLSVQSVAKSVKCPFLAIVGEDDQLCPIEYGYQTA